MAMVMGVIAIGGVLFFLWTLAFFSTSSMSPTNVQAGSAFP
jgi:hypothetical protein